MISSNPPALLHNQLRSSYAASIQVHKDELKLHQKRNTPIPSPAEMSVCSILLSTRQRPPSAQAHHESFHLLLHPSAKVR